MSGTYRTFVRSCTSWETFSTARKRTVGRGLTASEAQRACAAYNADRTPRQIARGTKMEWDRE